MTDVVLQTPVRPKCGKALGGAAAAAFGCQTCLLTWFDSSIVVVDHHSSGETVALFDLRGEGEGQAVVDCAYSLSARCLVAVTGTKILTLARQGAAGGAVSGRVQLPAGLGGVASLQLLEGGTRDVQGVVVCYSSGHAFVCPDVFKSAAGEGSQQLVQTPGQKGSKDKGRGKVAEEEGQVAVMLHMRCGGGSLYGLCAVHGRLMLYVRALDSSAMSGPHELRFDVEKCSALPLPAAAVAGRTTTTPSGSKRSGSKKQRVQAEGVDAASPGQWTTESTSLVLHPEANALSVFAASGGGAGVAWIKLCGSSATVLFARTLPAIAGPGDIVSRVVPVGEEDEGVGSNGGLALVSTSTAAGRLEARLRLLDVRYGVPQAGAEGVAVCSTLSTPADAAWLLCVASAHRPVLVYCCGGSAGFSVRALKARAPSSSSSVSSLSAVLGQLGQGVAGEGATMAATGASDSVLSGISRQSAAALRAAAGAAGRSVTCFEAAEEFCAAFAAKHHPALVAEGGDAAPVAAEDWDAIRTILAPRCAATASSASAGANDTSKAYGYGTFSLTRNPVLLDAMLRHGRTDLVLMLGRGCADLSEAVAVKLLYFFADRVPAEADPVTSKADTRGKGKGKRVAAAFVAEECDEGLRAMNALLDSLLDRPPTNSTAQLNGSSSGCGFNHGLLVAAFRRVHKRVTDQQRAMTHVALLLLLLSSKLERALGAEEKTNSRVRGKGKGKDNVAGGECSDRGVKRLTVWVEALLDAFMADFAVGLQLGQGSWVDVVRRALLILLRCSQQAGDGFMAVESALGLWIHLCRSTGGADSGCAADVAANVEGSDAAPHASIGGSSLARYQVEALYL